MEPVRAMAAAWAAALAPLDAGAAENFALRSFAAGCELLARAGLSHHRPPFGIGSVTVGGREVAVHEHAADVTPFGTLLHFKKDAAMDQPRVLVVAPLSGHFATLLRGTVNTLLPEHDVYLTDWHNARDVSLSHGRFGLDEYVDHIIRFLEAIGPGRHVVAVCQPCVTALAAVAIMAQAGNPAQPQSMTLMAGPSTRASTRPRSTSSPPAGRSTGSSGISSRKSPHAIPAPGGAYIPASCSSPPSWA